jgi:electron transport complex protein RnfE
MDKQKYKDALLGGVTSNPVFVLVIGMCPVIARSATFLDALVLGVATAFVLVMSNVFISCIRKLIPSGVRIPAYIVIVCALTTVMILFMESYMHELFLSLGAFLALVAVNCIIMARLEAFASKNGPIATLVDSMSMGIGFVVGICTLGIVREALVGAGFEVFKSAAGGFIVLGFLVVMYSAVVQKIIDNKSKQQLVAQSASETAKATPTQPAIEGAK